MEQQEESERQAVVHKRKEEEARRMKEKERKDKKDKSGKKLLKHDETAKGKRNDKSIAKHAEKSQKTRKELSRPKKDKRNSLDHDESKKSRRRGIVFLYLSHDHRFYSPNKYYSHTLTLASRLVEDDGSNEDMDVSAPTSPSSLPDHLVNDDREKTEEEKANWMAEYAPYYESMYDHIKRKRASSAKAAQNLSRLSGKKRR